MALAKRGAQLTGDKRVMRVLVAHLRDVMGMPAMLQEGLIHIDIVASVAEAWNRDCREARPWARITRPGLDRRKTMVTL